MHPLLSELEARDRIATRHREAEQRRLIRAVTTPRPLRVRLGGRLVRLGQALQGRTGAGAARPGARPTTRTAH